LQSSLTPQTMVLGKLETSQPLFGPTIMKPILVKQKNRTSVTRKKRRVLRGLEKKQAGGRFGMKGS